MSAWYFAATSGGEPPSTWPIIIPGIETRPRTFILLSVGISPVRSASCSPGRVHSLVVAPPAWSARRSAFSSSAFRYWLRPRLSALTALPSSMPQVGITSCASHHGSGRSTSVAAATKLADRPASSASSTCQPSEG